LGGTAEQSGKLPPSTVPFQHVLGGNWGLVVVIWGLPAVVGALAVLPRLSARNADIRVATPHVLGLIRDPLACQVTAYFGLISALAYAVFNWAPSILQARGLDVTESGLILSVCYISQTFAGLLAPIVGGRLRDQRLIVAAMVVLTALGLVGFVYAPISSLKLVAFMFGIGQGGAFGVALLLFALRSRDPHSASQLGADGRLYLRRCRRAVRRRSHLRLDPLLDDRVFVLRSDQFCLAPVGHRSGPCAQGAVGRCVDKQLINLTR
jgi:cyanate permease